MNISNAAAQTIEAKGQKGFSLIELLVVVAIIGVLAAAGIVGYQSYLDGVKTDTHKNNAITLGKALTTTGIARTSNLSVNPDECKTAQGANPASPDRPGTAVPGILPAGSPPTLNEQAVRCAQALAYDGKFKATLASVEGAAYIHNGACPAATTPPAAAPVGAGLISVSVSAGGALTIQACGAKGGTEGSAIVIDKF